MSNIENNNHSEQTITIPDENINNSGVDKDNVDSFGKFKTALELKTAYEKLEQEFTRKSQKLKELEARIQEQSENDKWATKVKELHQKYPVSLSLGEEITNYIKENKGLIEKDNCLESALLHVLATKYERKDDRATRHPIGADNIPPVISGGAVSVAPHVKPSTVKEANALASERLKQVKPKN